MNLYDDFNNSEYYTEAKNFLLDEYGAATEEEIYTRAQLWQADDLQTLLNDITTHFNTRAPVLAVGTVGTWRGTFKGGAIYKDFGTAFYKIFKDCDFFKITDDGGRLFVEGTHHDGTNAAEFVIITERGQNLFNKWSYNFNDARTEEEIHQIIYNSNLFSKIPHFARDFYGAKEERRQR